MTVNNYINTSSSTFTFVKPLIVDNEYYQIICNQFKSQKDFVLTQNKYSEFLNEMNKPKNYSEGYYVELTNRLKEKYISIGIAKEKIDFMIQFEIENEKTKENLKNMGLNKSFETTIHKSYKTQSKYYLILWISTIVFFLLYKNTDLKLFRGLFGISFLGAILLTPTIISISIADQKYTNKENEFYEKLNMLFKNQTDYNTFSVNYSKL